MKTMKCILMVVLGLAAALKPSVVRADSVTYSFSGTLVNSINGTNTVTGDFTLDFSSASITSFNFTTPTGSIDSDTGDSSITVFTPAISPRTDFVDLIFGGPGVLLDLIFETDLSSFSGSTFFTDAVTVNGGNALSGLVNKSPFSSGSAAPVPEPSSLLLLGTSLLGLMGIRQYRKRLA